MFHYISLALFGLGKWRFVKVGFTPMLYLPLRLLTRTYIKYYKLFPNIIIMQLGSSKLTDNFIF